MKVIKDPIKITWTIQQECLDNYSELGCGAVLEVSLEDIYLNFKQKSYSNSGDEYLHYYIDESYAFKCPCCGKENLINKNDIPERMRKLLKTTESSKKRLSDYKKTLSKK